MRISNVLGGVVAGAAAAYLLDPDLGRARRTQLRDRALGAKRRVAARAARRGRKVVSDVEGKFEAARAAAREPQPPADDTTLSDRVRSSVLGSGDIPAGEVKVDSVDGVVTLRGELPDRSTIERIVERTRSVPGVRAVNSLLHGPGDAPPNKEAARRASRKAAGSTSQEGRAIG